MSYNIIELIRSCTYKLYKIIGLISRTHMSYNIIELIRSSTYKLYKIIELICRTHLALIFEYQFLYWHRYLPCIAWSVLLSPLETIPEKWYYVWIPERPLVVPVKIQMNKSMIWIWSRTFPHMWKEPELMLFFSNLLLSQLVPIECTLSAAVTTNFVSNYFAHVDRNSRRKAIRAESSTTFAWSDLICTVIGYNCVHEFRVCCFSQIF